MKLTAATIVIGATLGGAAVGVLSSRPESQPKWEYRIENPEDSDFAMELNYWGWNGWELVYARRATNWADEVNYEVILKRRMQRPSADEAKNIDERFTTYYLDKAREGAERLEELKDNLRGGTPGE